MDHRDHVALIRPGVDGGGRTWADLGSGGGAFTFALAELLGPGAVIHSVDRDRAALTGQAGRMASEFPEVTLSPHVADFTRPLDLPALDGIVMANSLHFVADRSVALQAIVRPLRPGGRFVVVEYDTDAGNQWVPYPFSFDSWRGIASAAGLRETRHIGSVPSRFLGSIYSAVSVR